MSKDEEVPRHRSRKDRRKWCRGRVGVDHTPVWGRIVKYGSFGPSLEKHDNWLEFKCQVCHKVLDTWSPWINGYGKKRRNPPFARPVEGSSTPLKREDK